MNIVTYSLRTVRIDTEMGTVNKSTETDCKFRQPRVHRLRGPGTRLSTRTALAHSLRAYHPSPWDFLLRPVPPRGGVRPQKRYPSFLVPPTISPLPVNSSPITLMSQTPISAASSSSSNFRSIFDTALTQYKKKTKNDLIAHRLTAQLENCNSPSAILAVLDEQYHVQQFIHS